jgi:hypothetical protein
LDGDDGRFVAVIADGGEAAFEVARGRDFPGFFDMS